MEKRLQSGWSVDEAVETPLHGRHRGRQKHYECVVGGKQIGVEELARLTGIKTNTIYQRLHRGKTLQEVADKWATGT